MGRAGDWEEEEEGGRDDDASSRPSPLFAVLRTALDDAPPGSVAVLASWGGGAAPVAAQAVDVLTDLRL